VQVRYQSTDYQVVKSTASTTQFGVIVSSGSGASGANNTSVSTNTPSGHSSGISISAIIGISVAIPVVVIACIVLGAWFLLRRRRNRRQQDPLRLEPPAPRKSAEFVKPELDGTAVLPTELPTNEQGSNEAGPFELGTEHGSNQMQPDLSHATHQSVELPTGNPQTQRSSARP
jgi:hypothetical protein